MRIADIIDLRKKCTGCMACADVCPVKCISKIEGEDGFIYTKTEISQCINCGKCFSVCPIEIKTINSEKQHLYAAYAKNTEIHNDGSSGGMFQLLADYFLERNYYVCGAAFDEQLQLRHRIINAKSELMPLLKSKYVQSDMSGVYKRIVELLKNDKKVFFCGTPCQVSAVKNVTRNLLKKNDDRLFTADIICHGVPSQAIFDKYIDSIEKSVNGTISEFNFRVKDNKYKHAHGYSYSIKKNGQKLKVNGVYTQSSFYNAFKNYLIFRDSCYNCQYATLERCSDITLADFWGIEKYGFHGNIDSGVSMIIANTHQGQVIFSAIKDQIIYKEFPVDFGVKSNFCLTHSTLKPQNRDEIIESFQHQSYEEIARKYFSAGFKFKVYWMIPPKVRRFIRKIRDNKNV